MRKLLVPIMLIALLFTAGSAFAANENLFNFDQPTGYQPNPSAVKTVTADYTATTSDHMIQVNASAAVTITLPPMSTTQSGKGYIIKRIDSSTNTITVTASTTDSSTNYIGKAASRRLAVVQNAVLAIGYGAGKNWDVVWETPPIQADMSTGAVSIYTNGNISTSTGPLSGTSVYSAQTATTVSVTYADCGKIISMGTGTTIFSLPATRQGCEYTFINAVGGTDAPLTVDPVTADNIYGGCTLAASVVTIDDTAGDGVINTAATAVKGDFIRLMGDGDVGWFITGCQGIWAEL